MENVGGVATGNLTFSAITTINLRLFETFGQQRWALIHSHWRRGARLTLSVNNLLDQRVQVHDALGATPLSYQPGYIDASGRTVMLSVRKLFF